MNVRSDSALVLDSLEAIRKYMTNDILVLVDKAGWAEFADVTLPANKMEGLWHNCKRSPYRNITLGLHHLTNMFDSDWYCYIEPDALITSSKFKLDLMSLEPDVYIAGNDFRQEEYNLPIVERIAGKFDKTYCMLGCCLFFSKEFVKKLKAINFFERFLYLTNPFKETLPGFDEEGGYDVAEVVYPTLAIHLDGKIEHWARFDEDEIRWDGNYKTYPMRFRPEIDPDTEEFPDASIVHPLKSMAHPIRKYFTRKRKLG